MAAEEKMSEISPMKFVVLLVLASALSLLIVTGAKKIAPGTFGTIS
jgi:uncharacterized membrane protein YcaP (DUF421 family)